MNYIPSIPPNSPLSLPLSLSPPNTTLSISPLNSPLSLSPLNSPLLHYLLTSLLNYTPPPPPNSPFFLPPLNSILSPLNSTLSLYPLNSTISLSPLQSPLFLSPLKSPLYFSPLNSPLSTKLSSTSLTPYRSLYTSPKTLLSPRPLKIFSLSLSLHTCRLYTRLVCPVSVCRHCAVSTSQIFTV